MMKMMLIAGLMMASACSSLDDSGSVSSNSNGSAECTSSGTACTADAGCPSNEECDDGACKLHGGADATCEPEDGDDNGDDPQGTECTVDTDCAAGLECEDGTCREHGGGGSDD